MRNLTPHFPQLFEVLNVRSKRELDKHCRRLLVSQQDFVELILAARRGELAPYQYANHFARTVPGALIPNESENAAISKNGVGKFHTKGARKFASKLIQLFKERRSLAAHLFYTPDHRYWHLFYFDNRDNSDEKNHWKHGAHIHYVSDLWPELSMSEAWAQVHSGQLAFADKLHIRYRVR